MNQNGFSIIGVTIGASILSVMTLAISNLLISQSQAVSYMEDRMSAMSLERDLTLRLADRISCTNSFAGKPIVNTQTLVMLRDASNTAFLESIASNADSFFDNLKISNMRLVNDTASATPGSRGIMNLFVDLERSRKGGGSNLMRSREFKLSVLTAADGTIASCALADADSSANGEKACGKSPEGGYKRTCPNVSGFFCTNPTTSDYNHGDMYQKVIRRYRDSGGDSFATSAFWKCVNGSWIYAGSGETGYGGNFSGWL